MLEKIGNGAFVNCGFESFTVPHCLKKIGYMAFGKCRALRNFELNESIQELGFLCFWKTAISDLKIPPQAKRTLEELGVWRKDLKVLNLPDGLEAIGDGWFEESTVQTVVIPDSVKAFGKRTFYKCRQLREVLFGLSSHLESIGEECFASSSLRQIVIHSNVKTIGCNAFSDCKKLCEAVFNPDSCLETIEKDCFRGSRLRKIVIPRNV